MKGKFIVLEGIDGSGKTTLAHAIAEAVGGADLTFEPTRGAIGSALREGSFGDIPPAAEALLFAADRAIHTEEIRKTLDTGRWVICDRYLGSTVAYQSASLGEGADWDWLLDMQSKSVIEPDLTILLDIDPEISLKRVAVRGEALSRFEKLDFLRKVREAYLRLADLLDYAVVDATMGPTMVAETVLGIMEKKGLYAPQ
ncbi:MAG: dTMP kinase [archaeon]|nr:dTMP kinase [archaeon]